MEAGYTLDYPFDLIPDNEVTRAAGYTEATRSNASVWYGGSFDEERFYYLAWSGSIFNAPGYLPSILTCIERKSGKVIFSVNCNDYNLDTGANWTGGKNMLCRTRPFVLGDTVYLTSFTITNVGPQLFAVDKYNGKLKWAAAYYTPEGLPEYITQRGDYSGLSEPNARLSDLCPYAVKIGCGRNEKTLVFVGSSSLQNALNPSSSQKDFPKYTDQGFLFCIEDLGTTSRLVWKTPVCAPVLRAGAVVSNNGPNSNNPFQPGKSQTQIISESSTNNYFLNVYFPPAPINPEMPVGTTPIIGLFEGTQPIFSTQGVEVFKNKDSNLQWAYLTQDQLQQAKSQEGNVGILFFKTLNSGDVLLEGDEQGINYWGNSTWGQSVKVDLKRNLVYFGTGQSFESVLEETLKYGSSPLNPIAIRKPYIDSVTAYTQGLISLEKLNQSRKEFISKLREGALFNDDRSPRSLLTYPVSVIASYIEDLNGVRGGEIAFAVRSANYDVYSFLTDNPVIQIFPQARASDGDVPCGVTKYKSILSSSTKYGTNVNIDISCLKHGIPFNGKNLEEKGVRVQFLYDGPSGILGGANYMNDSSKRYHVSSQANIGWSTDNIRGSQGQFELQITEKGELIPFNNAFLSGIDVKSRKVAWTYNLANNGFGQVKCNNGMAYIVDVNGNLYICDAENGDLVWKFNGKKYGQNGGIASASVDKCQAIWMSNYTIPLGGGGDPLGGNGKTGLSFSINENALVTKCTDIENLLAQSSFVSWDTYEKTQNPLVPQSLPKNIQTIYHRWRKNCKGLRVKAVHEFVDGSRVFVKAYVRSSSANSKTVSFGKTKSREDVVYQGIYLLNKNTYELSYLLRGKESLAWFNVAN